MTTSIATVGTLADRELRVAGIYDDSQAFAHMIVDRSLYLAAVPLALQSDVRVFVRATPGADLVRLRAELTELTSPYLVVSVQDRSEFAAEQGAAIDTVLNLLYVLLLFSVVIAVLGIVNTLALSVLERTREIGLLRAVGLLRISSAGSSPSRPSPPRCSGRSSEPCSGSGWASRSSTVSRHRGSTPSASLGRLVLAMLVASILVGVLAAVAPSHSRRPSQHPAGDRRSLTDCGCRRTEVLCPVRRDLRPCPLSVARGALGRRTTRQEPHP